MTESIDYYMAQYAIDTSESKLTLADLIVARRLLDGFLRKVRRSDIDDAAAELAALKEQATRYQIVIGAIRVVPPSISKEDAAAAGRLARAVIDASETHHPQCNTILGTEWYCDCTTLRMLNVPDDAIVKRTEPEAVSSPQNQAEPLVPYDVSVPCDRCGALAGAPCTVVEGMGNLMQDALRPGDVLPSTPHFYGGRRQPPLVADPSRQPLAVDDMLYGRPCTVMVRRFDGDLAIGTCSHCHEEHYINAELFNEGRGPWQRVTPATTCADCGTTRTICDAGLNTYDTRCCEQCGHGEGK